MDKTKEVLDKTDAITDKTITVGAKIWGTISILMSLGQRPLGFLSNVTGKLFELARTGDPETEREKYACDIFEKRIDDISVALKKAREEKRNRSDLVQGFLTDGSLSKISTENLRELAEAAKFASSVGEKTTKPRR